MNYCYQYGSGIVQGTTIIDVTKSDIVLLKMSYVREKKKVYVEFKFWLHRETTHMWSLNTLF